LPIESFLLGVIYKNLFGVENLTILRFLTKINKKLYPTLKTSFVDDLSP
jgi:hypothetical protein